MAKSQIINDKIDYNDILCEAVDTIVKKRLENVSYDNTVVAEVIDAVNAQYGHYVVQEGKITYDVLSDNTSYKVGDKVYVTIPGNDYSKTKIILSAYKDEDEIKALSLVRPTDIYIKTKLPLEGIDEIVLTFSSLNSTNESTRAINEYVLTVPPKVQLNILKLLALCDSLILGAKIKCNLTSMEHYIYSGNYGLQLLVEYNNNEIELGSLSSENFIGNPYNLLAPVEQDVILNLVPFKHTFEIWSNATNSTVDSELKFKLRPFCDTLKYFDMVHNESSTVSADAKALENSLQLSNTQLPEGVKAQITSAYINAPMIKFFNFSVILGFNAKNKNKTLELYEAMNAESRALLPVWYNLDESTGEEIRFNDANTSTDFPIRDSLNIMNNSTIDHFEKDVYDKYNDLFNAGAPYRKLIHTDMRDVVPDESDLQVALDTKEALYIYSQGLELNNNIITLLDKLNDTYKEITNISVFNLATNEAQPALIDFNDNSTNAECVLDMSDIQVQPGPEYVQSISLKSIANHTVKSNYIFLTLKYLKNIIREPVIDTVGNTGVQCITTVWTEKVITVNGEEFRLNVPEADFELYNYVLVIIYSNTILPIDTPLLHITYNLVDNNLTNSNIFGQIPIFVLGQNIAEQSNDTIPFSPDNFNILSNTDNAVSFWPKLNNYVEPYTRAFYVGTILPSTNTNNNTIFGSCDIVDNSANIFNQELWDANDFSNNPPRLYATVVNNTGIPASCINGQYDLPSSAGVYHMCLPFYAYAGTHVKFLLEQRANLHHITCCHLEQVKQDNGEISLININTKTFINTSYSMQLTQQSIDLSRVQESGLYLLDIMMTQDIELISNNDTPYFNIRNLEIYNEIQSLDLSSSNEQTIEEYSFSLYDSSQTLAVNTQESPALTYLTLSMPAQEINYIRLNECNLVPNDTLAWKIEEHAGIISYLVIDDKIYSTEFVNTSSILLSLTNTKLVIINTTNDLINVKIFLPEILGREEDDTEDLPTRDVTPTSSTLTAENFIKFALTHTASLQYLETNGNYSQFSYKDKDGNNTTYRAVFPTNIVPEHTVGSDAWGYIYGTTGMECPTSPSAIANKRSYYWNNHYKNLSTYKNNESLYISHFNRAIGHSHTCDCQGLCDSFITNQLSSSFDINADMNYKGFCQSKSVTNFKIGDAVFTKKSSNPSAMGHVGWICGYLCQLIDNPAGGNKQLKVIDYLVVEAKSLKYGVVLTQYSQGSWHYHCRMDHEYGGVIFNYSDNLIAKGNILPSAADASQTPEDAIDPDVPTNETNYEYMPYISDDISNILNLLVLTMEILVSRLRTSYPRGIYLNQLTTTDYWSQSPITESTSDELIDNWLMNLTQSPEIYMSSLVDIQRILKNVLLLLKITYTKFDLTILKSTRPWHALFKNNFINILMLNSSTTLIESKEFLSALKAFCARIYSLFEVYYLIQNRLYLYSNANGNDIDNYLPILDMYFDTANLNKLSVTLDAIKLQLQAIAEYYAEYIYPLLEYLIYNNTLELDTNIDWEQLFENQLEVSVTSKQTNTLQSILNYLNKLTDSIAQDYEREKSLFLKFSKNRYDFYLYYYDSTNLKTDYTYLLPSKWQYIKNITINNLIAAHNNNQNDLTFFPLINIIDDLKNKSLRAILIYNHQPYYSNVLINEQKEGMET